MSESEIARGAMRKVSWRILPLLGVGYLVAYMDRINVSFAALQMNADLGFSATVYGLGGGLFFLSYALFEVPSNIFLAKFGARRWIARIMMTWGLVAAGMMFVRTPLQFYAMRFLLGIAEAGFFPGVIFYLSQWYPRRYRGRAISRYYVWSSISGFVTGAIAGWVLSLGGAHGLEGWQYLFLITGLPALLVGVLIWSFLPESPASVSWLGDEERAWIEHELAHEAKNIGHPAVHNTLAALAHPVVLRLGLFGVLTIGASNTLTLWVPQLLKQETGLSLVLVGWITSLGNLLGAIAILICGAWSDHRGERFSILLIATATIGAAYLVMSLGVKHSATVVVVAYLVWAFASMLMASSSVMLWPDLLHPRLLAVGAAAINTMCQIGAFAMPPAWGAARDVTGSFRIGLLGLAGATVFAWLIGHSLARRTRAGRPLQDRHTAV